MSSVPSVVAGLPSVVCLFEMLKSYSFVVANLSMFVKVCECLVATAIVDRRSSIVDRRSAATSASHKATWPCGNTYKENVVGHVTLASLQITYESFAFY